MSHSILSIILVAAAPLAAQDAARPPDAGLVIRSSTRLVQVNVIATRGGQPAADLKKEDFVISDNGKAQRISLFSQNSSSSLPATQTPLPPNTFTNRLQLKTGTPASITVILLDNLNTLWNDRVQARMQVVTFLKQIQPQDHIGIYALGSSLRVLHDYTSDATDLLRSLASYRGGEIQDLRSSGPVSGIDGGDALQLDVWLRGDGANSRERDFYARNRVFGTLKALEFIAAHLAQVPGRKSIIWLSGGFPLNLGLGSTSARHDPSRIHEDFGPLIDHAVRTLNDASVAIYPVDARGLMAPGVMNVRRRTVAGPIHAPGPSITKEPAEPENQALMEELGSRTGGRAFYNTNDIARAVMTAVADARLTYTLGYYPAEERFDGTFHRIEVKVRQDGLKLRYRKGYFDTPEQPQDAATRKAQLRDAVFSPLDATEIGLTAQVTLYTPKPGSYEVMIHVQPEGISLEKNQERWAGRLDVLLVQKDANGQQHDGRDDTIDLQLMPERYLSVIRQGLMYRQIIQRNPLAAELRILVRDARSGQMGSVTVPFRELRF
jgi:VWFA-related protein